MVRAAALFLTLASLLPAEVPVVETTYGSAVSVGGQVVPRYDKGYLLYLHRGDRLEAHKPDGALYYNVQLPCPGTGTCGASGVAVNSRGAVAVSFGYWDKQGRAGGIRLLDAQGGEARFIETGLYVPTSLCYDEKDNLWSIGWLRDAKNPDTAEEGDYAIVRKFSPDGKELGRFIPRALWPGKKSAPGSTGRGYWYMTAASDRIGAMIYPNFQGKVAEWVEWDLDGNLLRRTPAGDNFNQGRAYTSDGKLYTRVLVDGQRKLELRVLDQPTGQWLPVAANLPDYAEQQGSTLLGAHDNDLIYRLGGGNVRLLRVHPGPN
jgi:hypothetical protein